jgi:hypothetical protein
MLHHDYERRAADTGFSGPTARPVGMERGQTIVVDLETTPMEVEPW